SALSDALITTIGGGDTQFQGGVLLGGWGGRGDWAAGRGQKGGGFSFAQSDPNHTLTRAAISEHTVANGFNENVYFYGDSVGNFWIGTDTNPGVSFGPGGSVDSLRQVNIPQLINTNTSGGFTLTNPFSLAVPPQQDCTDDQVSVTGIAVNPVVDLGDFGLCGTIGEVVYVSVLDTEGCAILAANNRPIRTRIIAFAFVDGGGAGGLAPVSASQIFLSPFSNIAGVSVDDDGSLYFQLVDLIQFTGGAIFKLTEIERSNTCHGPATMNRFVPPGGGLQSGAPSDLGQFHTALVGPFS